MFRKMKSFMFSMALALAATSVSAAIDQALADAALAKGEKIAVWPAGKVPAQRGSTPYTIKNTNGGIVRLTNVDVPELAFFPAPGEGVKPCVLVCPGGGYSILAYYAALKRAGVKAEMHLFAKGGHGYGIRKHHTDVDGWEQLAAKWLGKFKK